MSLQPVDNHIDVKVRIAHGQDADVLSALNYEFNQVKVSSKYIAESLGTGQEIVAIASVGGSVAGFACAQFHQSFCYSSPCGELTEMYVREAYRRNGVASTLIMFLEDALLERGVTTVRILTGQDNGAALGLYCGLGYLKEDEVVLVKELSRARS